VTELKAKVEQFLADHPTEGADAVEWLGARFDAGLAWVHFPVGFGGLGASRSAQQAVDEAFLAANAPQPNPAAPVIGYGMAAPTILKFGTDEQRQRFLRPLYTGEEVWCQLFSEPGAGSDLATLATRAVRDGDEWVVDGQKVWTTMGHVARWGILVARTDPSLPKHQGLSYFLCDMTDPGVEVRPLRQITGEAEFNEVFLSGVRVPDANRLGAVGEGWKVATTTLMNERVTIGAHAAEREDGLIGAVTKTWRERPELHTPGLHDRLLRLWVDAEALRLTAERLRQGLAAGQPGPEGSAAKLTFATLNQAITGLDVELHGEEGLSYKDWTMRRPKDADWASRDAGFRYLRMKGNSIEGGTSEILRNIIADRILQLPKEPRGDVDIPWKDLPR